MSGSEREANWGRLSGSTWRTILLVVTALTGAAILLALVFTQNAVNRERDRAFERSAASYELIILARMLQGTIARSEASLGRYVISGDKALGRVYFEQWRLAGQLIRRLDQMTREPNGGQSRVDALRVAYQDRGRELSLTALSTNYGKNEQALARYYQARKASSLTAIDTLLDDIIAREVSLLHTRRVAAKEALKQSNRIAGIVAVFGILIVIGAITLGWVIVQAISQRAYADAEAERERERASELEAAVATATIELRMQEGKLRQVQKMDAVGQLTGGIAHDFNNMLAVVIGGLELAAHYARRDAAVAARHIDSAMEGANRAAALTRRLLAFSREEPLHVEPIDPGVLIAGMSDLLDRTLGDTISVTVRHSDDGWHVCADRHQLENAILNLAVNARDAMDGRGELTITTAGATLAAEAVGTCAAGEYVSIAVSDSGCGMPPEVMERVFEPFFTTKPVGQGTGLGLSQIFAFVHQARGEIAIASQPGEGTTVTLYLPRHISDAVATEQVTTPARREHMAALDILVVEDDPRVLAATMGALDELGHRPLACNDPLAAQALLDAIGGVDLIVSDVLMPGLTGPEMVAALAAQHRRTPVLFVTGFAGEAGGAEFGGRVVLRKPFTLAALERAVAEVMAADGPVRSLSIAAE